MTKVGLKDTLTLLAKGYSKKDIDALAAIDEENENDNKEVPAPIITDSAPAPAAEEPKEPEIDYKALYEEQLQKTKDAEERTKKLQQDNVHKNAAPAAAEMKAQQSESLLSMVRDFM